jgi:hypothetical protein
MAYKEKKEKYLKEKRERREKEEEELKQRWIEKWGEEHYNHTDKIVKNISKGISEILYKDNKEEK